MAIYLNGLFISAEQRFKEGKTDGFNILVADGAEARRVKVSSDVYVNCALDALKLGDAISCKVKVNSFRDKTYLTAENVQLVEEG